MRTQTGIRTALLTMPCLALLVTAIPAQADDQRSETLKSKTITYQVGDLTCQGYLAWDSAVEGKRPGVLVVHEWWGLNDYARQRADQLAELGYLAFACDMYGDGKTTTHPQEASAMASKVRENIDSWRDRALAGLEVLTSQEQCDTQRLGAIGYCFGGATALQLAYTGADVDAVVTFHAALPVPTLDEARNIKARLLINHGADDGFIPQETIQQLTNVLNEADVEWKLISYPGARHSFTNKSADEHGIDGLAYNAEADRKSWQGMKDVFREEFSK